MPLREILPRSRDRLSSKVAPISSLREHTNSLSSLYKQNSLTSTPHYCKKMNNLGEKRALNSLFDQAAVEIGKIIQSPCFLNLVKQVPNDHRKGGGSIRS
ncbi:hypothetical protein Dimus_023039 [Dionaea muscipula]